MSLIPITVNSGVNDSGLLVPQPTRLREWREWIQTDKTAIDGGMQRNRISSPGNPNGYKYIIEMDFLDLTTSQFSTIASKFVSGSGVVYHNPQSKYGDLTFSGLPFVDENAEYAPGESLLSGLKVRIRQF